MKPEIINVTTELEFAMLASIEEAGKKVQKIIASIPVVDVVRLNESMENIRSQSKAKVEEMREKIKSDLERAGFQPVYSNH